MEEYVVTINGIEHHMMLSKEDAARYGDQAKKAGSPTQTKARTSPANKSKD